MINKLRDKEEQVKTLEAAISALTAEKDLVEERTWLKRVATDMAEAQVAWEADKEKVAADKAALVKAFEATKDSHANFAYIMAFAAIRASRRVDPSGDLSSMVNGLANYACDYPSDPTHYLEIRYLEALGVDLSFFPNQSQIVMLETTEAETIVPAAEPNTTEVGVRVSEDTEDVEAPKATD